MLLRKCLTSGWDDPGEGSMEMQHARGDGQRDTALAKFILTRKSEILALWEGAVRRLPTARELPNPILFDSVPQLLEAIAASHR